MTNTYDLRTSQYDHPDAKPGQHTNGPAKLFVRRPGGRWYRVRMQTTARNVRVMIAMFGFDDFISGHCDPAPKEPPQ